MRDRLNEGELNLLKDLCNLKNDNYITYDFRNEIHQYLIKQKLIKLEGNLLTTGEIAVMRQKDPNKLLLTTYPRLKITYEGQRQLQLYAEDNKNEIKTEVKRPLLVKIIWTVLTIIVSLIIYIVKYFLKL